MPGELTPEESERVKTAVAEMDDETVAFRLEEMAKRELALLGSPAFERGPLREETILNAAALAAAAERLAPLSPDTEQRG